MRNPKILSVIFLSILTVTPFLSVSFFPRPVSAQTLPTCIDGQYYSPPLSGVNLGWDGLTARFYNNSDRAECAPTAAQRAARPYTGIAAPAVCTGIVSCITLLPRLLFQYGTAAIALVFVSLSSLILSIAALLFNWLVDHTIIQFGTTYTDAVKKAVETAWTAFRDIANILIIGIFTFIAISIILGLKEYGQKKMIAHVLIIAVLINFSLLFTKMIIDGSNYTATQVYTAAGLGSTQGKRATGNKRTQ